MNHLVNHFKYRYNYQATVMPRGSSLGMVMQLPDGDQTSQSRKQVLLSFPFDNFISL